MKKVLSLILALTMLLGCSLTAFALEMKEPCEFCDGGEILPELQPVEGKYYIDCPACSAEQQPCSVYYDYYYCDNCGEFAYRIFDHTVVDCAGCKKLVLCFTNPLA